jgi:ATP-dependent helicase/nuclease subunit A
VSLTPEQLAAAHRDSQDVCVVAGPGSGKTSVLIERFRWLVEDCNVPPHRILAVTFTEKAAAEIRRRLERSASAADLDRAWISTIHGFCARLLRENAVAAALDPEFVVLDAIRSLALARECADAALDACCSRRPADFAALLDSVYSRTDATGRSDDLADALLAIYGESRVAGRPVRTGSEAPVDPMAAVAPMLDRALREPLPLDKPAHRDFRGWARRFLELAACPPGRGHFEHLAAFDFKLTQFKTGSAARAAAEALKKGALDDIRSAWIGLVNAPLGELLVEALARIDEEYRSRKRALAALDFSDLEERAISLLENHPGLRRRVSDGFDHMLMDELQDTNPLQWRLVDLVRRPGGFFAVGDINQSIYGFRRAEPEIFARYRAGLVEAGLAVDELRENHRSRPEILEAIHAILGAAPGIEPHRLVAARITGPKAQPSVEVIIGRADAMEEAARVESRWIARRIRELEGSLPIPGDSSAGPLRLGDVAVLARSAHALVPVQEALDEFGVPSIAGGGRTFFESREVRDLAALLGAVADPADAIALATVMRSPLLGVSDETLLRLALAGGLDAPLDEIAEPERSRLAAFRAMLDEARAFRDDLSPDRLLIPFLDAGAYDAALPSRGRANVEKFLGMLRDSHEREPRALAAVVAEIAVRRAAELEPEAPPADPHAVRLMTIHQAKGLQFPVVVVAELQRGVDRRSPALRLDLEGRLGVRWRDPAGGSACGDPSWRASHEEENRRAELEENRLLYVAMTRAREHLILAFAQTARSPAKWPSLVSAGLGIDPLAMQPESWLRETGSGPRVQVLCSDRAPSNDFPPIAATAGSEPAWVDRPAPPDSSDGSATVTDIALFVACPRRYALERYLGVERAPVPGGGDDASDVEATELGDQVHRLLAGLPVAAVDAEALDLANRFRASQLGRRAAAAARRELEFDFILDLDGLVLRGRIDLWFDDAERLLIDYKTDRFDPRQEPDSASGYIVQAQLYAIALERLDGRRPDRAVLAFLRHELEIDAPLGEAGLNAARASVTSFRRAQSAVEFPLRPGAQCLRCPYYRGACPAGT